MSFSRSKPTFLQGAELGAAMRNIGLRVGPAQAAAGEPADIEQALASAVHAALPHDFRVLGVVLAWLEVHGARVNVPRLGRFLSAASLDVERALWSAVGRWLGVQDSRWRALERLHRGDALSLDDAQVTELQIARAGEDPRFVGSALRVYDRLLRSRPEDVDDVALLAGRHGGYRRRMMLGTGYRADAWEALERSRDASAAEIARNVGCAYETARLVREDWIAVRDLSAGSANQHAYAARQDAAVLKPTPKAATFKEQHPEFQHLVRELAVLTERNRKALTREVHAPVHLFSLLALAFITLERFLRIALGPRAREKATLHEMLQQASGKKARIFTLSERDKTIELVNTMRVANMHGLLGDHTSSQVPVRALMLFALDLVDFVNDMVGTVSISNGVGSGEMVSFTATQRELPQGVPVFSAREDLLVIRYHNLLFREEDRQDTLLLQAETALSVSAIEATCRGFLSDFSLDEGHDFRSVLTAAVTASPALRVSVDDQLKITEVRNSLAHANYEQAARGSGAGSIREYFKKDFAGEAEHMFRIYEQLRAQCERPAG